MTKTDSSKIKPVLVWSFTLFILAGADLLHAPHAPMHQWPQVGIYLTLPLCGIGVCLLLALCIRAILTRGKDYYAKR